MGGCFCLCKLSCIHCVENLQKFIDFARLLDFYRFTTMRRRVCFATLQNPPSLKLRWTGVIPPFCCGSDPWVGVQILFRATRDSLGQALRGNRNDFGALSLPKSTACRTWGPHLSRLDQNKKRPQGSFVILVAAKGFGPLTKGL